MKLCEVLNPSIEEAIKQYVKLHNAAGKEFKAAFQKVGARMWRDDNAHDIKPQHLKAMLDSADKESMKWNKAKFKSIYVISRPLTMLDSYPDVASDPVKMKSLNKEVDAIKKKYQAELNKVFQF